MSSVTVTLPPEAADDAFLAASEVHGSIASEHSAAPRPRRKSVLSFAAESAERTGIKAIPSHRHW